MAQVLPIDPAIPRRALVTGGAKRLGRAIGLALAHNGFDLVLHCRGSRDEAEAVAAEVRAMGRACDVVAADLADEAQVRTLIERCGEGLGVLVNNASAFETGDWSNTDRANWDAHLEPNLRAPFVLMQDFARALPERATGVVINMLDQRVWSLTPHFIAYTVSKVGLWGLTQSMALALAPRIRVNAIGPGPALPSSRQTQAQFDRQCSRLPLRRGTDPDEIGRAALAILALPSLTGQMLALDGGQHLQWGSAPAEE
jgi:NAD(P)-dependent dehydrogenase (short-subunit alcohol dehydrogenase family)